MTPRRIIKVSIGAVMLVLVSYLAYDVYKYESLTDFERAVKRLEAFDATRFTIFRDVYIWARSTNDEGKWWGYCSFTLGDSIIYTTVRADFREEVKRDTVMRNRILEYSMESGISVDSIERSLIDRLTAIRNCYDSLGYAFVGGDSIEICLDVFGEGLNSAFVIIGDTSKIADTVKANFYHRLQHSVCIKPNIYVEIR